MLIDFIQYLGKIAKESPEWQAVEKNASASSKNHSQYHRVFDPLMADEFSYLDEHKRKHYVEIFHLQKKFLSNVKNTDKEAEFKKLALSLMTAALEQLFLTDGTIKPDLMTYLKINPLEKNNTVIKQNLYYSLIHLIHAELVKNFRTTYRGKPDLEIQTEQRVASYLTLPGRDKESFDKILKAYISKTAKSHETRSMDAPDSKHTEEKPIATIKRLRP